VIIVIVVLLYFTGIWLCGEIDTFFLSIRQHYNVNLKGIEVGGSLLQLPTDLFETGDKKGTIIDSGTTLTYLPEAAYKSVWEKVLAFL